MANSIAAATRAVDDDVVVVVAVWLPPASHTHTHKTLVYVFIWSKFICSLRANNTQRPPSPKNCCEQILYCSIVFAGG